MKVTFTNARGISGTWDGCLWDCPGDREMQGRLNQEALPERGPHQSVVDCARHLLESYGGLPVLFELVDVTGLPRELLGEDVFFMEEEVEAAEEAAHSGNHDRTTETGSEGSALAAGEAFLGGGVLADETDAEDEDDWDGPEAQWTDFTGWCGRENLILKVRGPERDGGREHDVRFNDTDGRWWKYTKPNLSGYTVSWTDDGQPFLRNARVLEYLARLRRQNELLEDDIRLEGLWWDAGRRGGWRIVTSQPDVPGRTPTMEEIRAGMEAMEFKRLRWTGIGYEFAEAWRMGRMGVWDVHPSNVVLAENGIIVPIDVIITRLPDGYAPCHFHA